MHRRLDSMASQPVVHVGLGDCLSDVARLMAARRLSCVPIVDGDGRVHGMVSENRLLDVLRGEVESSLRKVDGLVNEINRKWPFKRETELKLP